MDRSGRPRIEKGRLIDLAYSNLAISELWEYGSVYKAELSDTNGVKAFDPTLTPQQATDFAQTFVDWNAFFVFWKSLCGRCQQEAPVSDDFRSYLS